MLRGQGESEAREFPLPNASFSASNKLWPSPLSTPVNSSTDATGEKISFDSSARFYPGSQLELRRARLESFGSFRCAPFFSLSNCRPQGLTLND